MRVVSTGVTMEVEVEAQNGVERGQGTLRPAKIGAHLTSHVHVQAASFEYSGKHQFVVMNTKVGR